MRRRKLTEKEECLLRSLCDARIKKLESCISRAAGSLYPAIWANEIGAIEGLFENLAGRPWKESDDAASTL